MVQIPAGTAPNAIIQVRAPDGRNLNVRVPPNVRPGQQMRISVPAAAPKATKPASEAQERDARRQRREEAARDRAVKAAKVPANPSRGRLPVAGLVGKSFGLYQKDTKAWLALDETKRLVKIDVGHRFSRKSAMKLCEERGGRLAYRREVVDEKSLGATPKLRVNGGKAFGGNKWTPVLDGDPNRATEGIGWVQIGDPKRLGKNHREVHQSDCAWGGQGHHMGHKGPWIWCVKEGPHGPFLVKINVGHSFTRTSAQQLCRERGGRLAYRRELVDEATLMPQLLVNDGKAFGGDKRAPVSLMIVA